MYVQVLIKDQSIHWETPCTESPLENAEDGNRSAFTPYKPVTVLTNLQRGNIQTEGPAVLPERSVHQLAGQGELFLGDNCVLGTSFDANVTDEKDFTPLMWASGFGQLETVQKLLKLGAVVTSTGKSGENALILASSSGHAAIVRELINYEAEVDCVDQDGNTALMHAVYNNHAACVQELLNAGADFTITNEAVETAFDIAIKKRSKHAQAVLEKHMLNLMQVGSSTPTS
ncbi:hypothetical protein JTE90_016870 [Oedothorax gibbosus]|uniref:Ankyrin repeat family A protein 2 n=1 Tax=Oedothorax gibbosus TaxID=931172 RepID=A0AAV6W0W7_9ARAC|nr:hypothetical protein JTE90_016870 [Oedothorax gibbosus]